MQPKAPNPLGFIRRYARPRPAHERCELCSAPLAAEHEHLLEPAARRLVCACTPCAVLFGHRGDAKFRRVPRRVEHLRDLRLTDVQWEGFGLPVALAFFAHSTPAGRVVAAYPSPAGATESLLPLDAWEELLEENPGLRDLEPDVEALLVDRAVAARAPLRGGPPRGLPQSPSCFRVGIDQCYRLVGIVRTHWQGFSGGDAVWAEIDRFFAELGRRAGAAGGQANA